MATFHGVGDNRDDVLKVSDPAATTSRVSVQTETAVTSTKKEAPRTYKSALLGQVS